MNTEKPFLSQSELQTLLDSLRKNERERNTTAGQDWEAYQQSERQMWEEASVEIVAHSHWGTDVVEALSEWFRIEFDVLWRLPIMDGSLLFCEFLIAAPKETTDSVLPETFEMQQQREAREKEIELAGGIMKYLEKWRSRPKPKFSLLLPKQKCR